MAEILEPRELAEIEGMYALRIDVLARSPRGAAMKKMADTIHALANLAREQTRVLDDIQTDVIALEDFHEAYIRLKRKAHKALDATPFDLRAWIAEQGE